MYISEKIGAKLNDTFASLKHKNFRYFWFGQCISLIGTWVQRTAQVWLVYSLTKSPFLLGILGVAQFSPMLIFSLFAGVLIDRFPKKKLLLITQTVFMLQSLTLALLVWFGIARYWHILVLATVFGFVQTVETPTRQSFFVDLVGKDDLPNAISLNSVIVNLAKIIGPAIAGVIMIETSPAFCFFLNSISFIAVLYGLTLIKVEEKVIIKMKGNIFGEIKQGVRYALNREVLKFTLIILAIVATFAMNADVIIPVFAKEALGKGAREYTTLLSSMGIGSLLGATILAGRSKRKNSYQTLIIIAISVSVIELLTVLCKNFYIANILIAAIGFLNLTFLNTANYSLQMNLDGEYRGRVMSIYSLLVLGSTPIGNFYAGTVMENFSGSFGFFACGLISLILTVLLIIISKTCHKKYK